MIIIYSKAGCPNCENAKNMLEQYDIDYTVIKIDENPEARNFVLKEGHREVPQLYVGQDHLGGWKAVSAMTREQILDKVGEE